MSSNGRPRLALLGSAAALAVVGVSLLTAGPPRPQPPKGFEAIFNGQDLKGWDGGANHWKVEDSCLTGTADGKLKYNRFLTWRGGKVRNFELRVQVRVSPGGNSGINYRSTPRPDLGEHVVTGYQCDVVANRADYNGMLYEERGRRILAHTGERVVIDPAGQPWVVGAFPLRAFKPGEWHEYRVLVEGNRHRHWIDGHPTVDVIDLDKKGRQLEGVLAVQVHVGPPMKIQYRDFFLRRLPDDLLLIAPDEAKIPPTARKVVPQGKDRPRKPAPPQARAGDGATLAQAAKRVRQLVAHRESSSDRPENTLASYRRAIEAGATANEVDVRTTRDGVLVSLHDADVKRTTDGKGSVRELTLAELRRLDAGSWFDRKFAGERVPTLREVLELCRDRADVLLDLKETGEEYIRRVVAEVRQHGQPARIILGIRKADEAERFRKLLPEARQLGLIPDPGALDAFAAAGVKMVRLWPKWVAKDPGLVARVRRLGLSLHLNGTTGAEDEVRALLLHRPDSLSADDPGRLRQTLGRLMQQ